jgi:hypothetical protein
MVVSKIVQIVLSAFSPAGKRALWGIHAVVRGSACNSVLGEVLSLNSRDVDAKAVHHKIQLATAPVSTRSLALGRCVQGLLGVFSKQSSARPRVFRGASRDIPLRGSSADASSVPSCMLKIPSRPINSQIRTHIHLALHPKTPTRRRPSLHSLKQLP